MYCRTCRYLLVKLPEHRCPECGTSFDPANSDTFISDPRGVRYSAIHQTTAGICIFGGAVNLITMLVMGSVEEIGALIFLLVFGVIMLAPFAGLFLLSRSVQWNGTAAILALIGGIAMIGAWVWMLVLIVRTTDALMGAMSVIAIPFYQGAILGVVWMIVSSCCVRSGRRG